MQNRHGFQTYSEKIIFIYSSLLFARLVFNGDFWKILVKLYNGYNYNIIGFFKGNQKNVNIVKISPTDVPDIYCVHHIYYVQHLGIKCICIDYVPILSIYFWCTT